MERRSIDVPPALSTRSAPRRTGPVFSRDARQSAQGRSGLPRCGSLFRVDEIAHRLVIALRVLEQSEVADIGQNDQLRAWYGRRDVFCMIELDSASSWSPRTIAVGTEIFSDLLSSSWAGIPHF